MARTNEEEIEISVADLLHSVWDVKWLVLLLTLLGGMIGALLSAGGGSSYETAASMLVTAQVTGGVYQNGSSIPGNEDIRLAQDLTKTVQLLSTSDRVLIRVLEEAGDSEASLETLKRGIQVTGESGTSFLRLTLSWDDPQQAVKLLNCLMDVLPEVMLEVMDIGAVHVIDMARQAEMVSGGSARSAGLFAAAGLALGCAVGAVYYLFAPKIRSNNTLEALGLDVIGEIPLLHLKGEMSGYLDDGNAPREYREAYGRLAAVFRYLAGRERQQVVAVTSGVSGEGKSTVAYNLALQLTELGCRVLLLDFDFKKGMLYRLAKSRKPPDGQVRTQPRNGEHLDQQVERMFNGIYTIQGFAEKDIFQAENDIFPAIQAMKDSFDYIIIDTPPVGILSDVQQMRGLMDGVLLVVRQAGISRKMAETSLEFLEKSGITVIGSVLNFKEQSISKR